MGRASKIGANIGLLRAGPGTARAAEAYWPRSLTPRQLPPKPAPPTWNVVLRYQAANGAGRCCPICETSVRPCLSLIMSDSHSENGWQICSTVRA